MKILFLCGCLEPGRDGVGDYTRRLAGECIRQGHEARIIALNDKHSEIEVESSKSQDERLRLGDEQGTKNKEPSTPDSLRSFPSGGVSEKNQEPRTPDSLRSFPSGGVSEKNKEPRTKNQEQRTKHLGETQSDYGTEVPVLRLPAGVPWRKRMPLALAYTSTFDPDWISLQYVPYSFHPKGLPFGLPQRIQQLLEPSTPDSLRSLPFGGVSDKHSRLAPLVSLRRGLRKALVTKYKVQRTKYYPRRLHIMFHELWLGMNRDSSLKEKAIGYLQKWISRKLAAVAPGPVIHTQTQLYLQTLRSCGIKADYLPLFGNIPVIPEAKLDPELAAQLDGAYVALHFGTFSVDTDALENHLNNLKKIAIKEHKPLHFISAGNAGRYAEAAKQAALSVLPDKQVHFLGAMDASGISALMERADIGVTRSGYDFLEKSGAVMSFITHGLSLVSYGLPPDSHLQQALTTKIDAKSVALDSVTNKFLNSLQS